MAVWQSPQTRKFLVIRIGAPAGDVRMPYASANFSLCSKRRSPFSSSSTSWRAKLVSGTYPMGSPEELGRLLDTTGLFELLPLREELRPLSESGCRKEGKKEAVIGNQSARMTTWKTERDKLTEIIWKIVYYCSQLLTASLEDGTSSEDLCLEWSPCKPCPEPFLLANASTAPENLSRISCPTRRNI